MSMKALLKRFVGGRTAMVATATVATLATDQDRPTRTVAKVAAVSVAKAAHESEAITPACADAPDSDRFCWPHSEAWNSVEVVLFLRREALFNERGLAMDAAEALAENLVLRDRDFDERVVCLECAHYLHGCCTNWMAAGYVRAEHAVLGECGRMLKRCAAFAKATDAEVESTAT